MASFFGEVVHQSSRAFLDDVEDFDDDDFSDEKRPKFVLIGDNEEIESYEIMLFATDDVSVGFTSSLILNDTKRIALIKKSIEKHEYCGSKKQNVAEIYKIDDRILLFKYISIDDLCCANELLSLVQPWLACSLQTIVLTSRTTDEHRSLYNFCTPKMSFIRSLKTNSFKDVFALPLQIPNSLTGFPAAVASLCQAMNQPCVVYVFYFLLNPSHKSLVNVEPLENLFLNFEWYRKLQNKSKISEVSYISVNNQITQLIENSNLYL